MLRLYLQAPFAAFRTFTAGWYRPTAGFLTPSAAYGLALNLAGIETRRDDGLSAMTVTRFGLPPARIALGAVADDHGAAPDRPDDLPAAPQLPGRGLGQGAQGRRQGEQVQHHARPPRVPRRPPRHRRPRLPRAPRDRGPRSARRRRRDVPDGRPRYGLPFLGDNAFLIDKLKVSTSRSPPSGIAASAARADAGPVPYSTRLTTWVDRQDMSRTRSALFAPLGDGERGDPRGGLDARSSPPPEPTPPAEATREERMTHDRRDPRPAPAGHVPPRPGLLPAPLLPDRGRGAPGRRTPPSTPAASCTPRSPPTRTASGPSSNWPTRRSGLVGKVDAIRRRDGSLIPYEHKRGKARRDGKAAEAWPSDRLQVVAYAVLIESATGQAVPEGRVRYHADNVTVRVPIDDAARADLAEAIATARRLRESTERPPVAENERLCVRCSLAPVCLPEEVRQADDPEPRAGPALPARPRRRQPPRRHRRAPGRPQPARPSSSRRPTASRPPSTPIREVDSLLLHGYAQVTTQALDLCVDRDVPVHWLTTSGHHTASLTATAGQVQRRVRQYRALADEATCLRLAKALARAKVEGQHRYLLRGSRGDDAARDAMLADLVPLRSALASIDAAADRDSLRGLEGSAAVGYFRGLARLLAPSVPEIAPLHDPDPPAAARPLQRPARVRLRPAPHGRDAGDPGRRAWSRRSGFFHTPRSAAYPLVLDLMELFRVPLWDMVLVGSLNRGQWDPDADFVATKAKVWLSDAGRKKAIGLFEARLDETWKHPVIGYSLSYARALELEARLLEKEWSGEPGLFARMRLR